MTRSVPKPAGYVALAALLLALLAVQAWAAHRYFTSQVAGGNDFYPRWYGAQTLLIDGRNPYSSQITTEIEAVLDPLQQRTNSFNFAFPLHVLFLFWPLVYLPYAWAQAVWMVVVLWCAAALSVLLTRLWPWQISAAGMVVLLLLVLTAYPVVRTVFLGQFTLHVALFVVVTLLLLRRGRDGWAGAVLALASIKPQMAVLIAPGLVLWTIAQRRWRFVGGLAAGGAVLLVASLALLPRWPLDFVHGLGAYAAVAGGRNTLLVLGDRLWPANPEAIRWAVALLLIVGMALSWRRAWLARDKPDGEEALLEAVGWAVVVTLLVPFQTGTTNQVLLLLPLAGWVAAQPAGRRPALALAALLFSVAVWVLFRVTLRGAAESELMFFPGPVLALLLLGDCALRRRRARQAEGYR